MRKLFCLLLFCTVCRLSVGYGQGSAPEPVNLLPPSPAATQMLRFGEYPVSLFTGQVDISVPIYTIEVNGISLPISLKYHASGIKYDDVSTGVGLGWMLDAGGLATYKKNGLGRWDSNDYNYDVFVKLKNEIAFAGSPSEEVHFPTDLNMLLELSKIRAPYNNQYPDGLPTADGECDIITYSFPGHYGKAGCRKDTEIFSFNDDPHFISAGANDISVTDENGIQYVFEDREFQSYPNYLNQLETYHLSKIISADGKDIVELEYLNTGDLYISKPSIMEWATVSRIYDLLSTLSPGNSNLTRSSARAITIAYYPKLLSKIKFRGGEVQFQYSTTGSIWLQNIKIIHQGIQTRVVSLEKGNFGNGQTRLDKVIFSNASDIKEYDYEFEYEPLTYNVPSGKASVDYWGYYNGGMGGGSYLPTFMMNGRAYEGMSRAPNEAAMKAGMIKKMYLPTGGCSEFTFEPHNAYGTVYGGLRIAQIDHYDSSYLFLYRNRYKYDIGQNVCPNPSLLDYYFSQSFSLSGERGQYPTDYSTIFYGEYTTYTAFSKNLQSFHGSSVVYPVVTEYRESDVNGDGGETTYEYTYQYPDSSDTYNGTNRGHFAPLPLHSYDYKNGKLKAKTVLDKNRRTVYSLHNTYEEKNERKYSNLHVDKLLKSIRIPVLGIDDYRDFVFYLNPSAPPSFEFPIGVNDIFEYYNYYHVCGRYVLTKSVETKDGVATSTTYAYPLYPDESHRFLGADWPIGQTRKIVPFPSEITKTSADGQKLISRYKYPYDFPWDHTVYGYNLSNNNGMVGKNILTPVVEQSEHNGNVSGSPLLSLVRTNYSSSPTSNSQYNRYAPSSIQTQGKSGSLETRVEYKRRDDYGNPQWIVQDGLDIVYLWDTNSLYPTMEVRGATYAQVQNALSAAGNSKAAMRDYFKNNNINALVSWYTYTHGVGMTSATDPSGRTTYYDYDNQNRLSTVRDTEQNVVEQYKYNYKQ